MKVIVISDHVDEDSDDNDQKQAYSKSKWSHCFQKHKNYDLRRSMSYITWTKYSSFNIDKKDANIQSWQKRQT